MQESGPPVTPPAAPPQSHVAQQVQFIDLGRMRYDDALARQRAEQERLIADRAAPMTVFLVEHDPPVITVTRRPGAANHLLAAPAALARLGVEVSQTDRGGDITYHGPGQLVVYPILDLNRLGLRVHSYMRFLEDVVIATIARWGIAGHRDACATGVWVPMNGATGLSSRPPVAAPTAAHAAVTPDPPAGGCVASTDAKICAMGVRISRWVTMHGLALNVNPDMNHFSLIVPCGLAGRQVTSLARILGDRCPPMNEVRTALKAELRRAIDTAMATASTADSARSARPRGADQSVHT